MLWIAPTGNDAITDTLEKQLRAGVRQLQIQSLRRTRDLLLPLTLSGQTEFAPSNGKETKQ